jgi:molecular chaperone GrpE
MKDKHNSSVADVPQRTAVDPILDEETAGPLPEEGAEPSADEEALAERVLELEQQAAESQDRYLRAVADMENLRRRHRQEMEEARRFGNEQLLGSLVSVLDNLQRALEAAQSGENFAALKDGVSLTQKQLLDVLARSGLEPIEAVGQPFDPTLHEAIGRAETEEQAPDTVVEEIQRGFTLHGRLLRPSLVRIAG